MTLFAIAAPACTRGNAVVEAPMMSADASALEIASGGSGAGGPPPALPHTPSIDLPFATGDRLTGTYMCNQGKTAMILTFEEISVVDEEHVDVDAVFEFHYDGYRAGFSKADGSARMRGKYDPLAHRLKLIGDEWIDQPPNYLLITLNGIIGKNGAYAGSVEGQGCTTFSAIREHAN